MSREVLPFGREIVSAILREGELQPFLDAGVAQELFDDVNDWRAYRFIREDYDTENEVMSTGMFQATFHDIWYPLAKDPPSVRALAGAAARQMREIRQLKALDDLNELRDVSDAEFAVVMEKAAQQLRESGDSAPPPLDLRRVDELDDSPVEYRIDGLMPAMGTVIISAYAKVGKSTLALNAIRSIAAKEDFLGLETTTDGGRHVYLAFEMEESWIRKCAEDAGITPEMNVEFQALKGKAARFNVLDPGVRSAIADQLAHAETVTLDPIGPLMSALGLSEDNNPDVSKFREACECLMSEAGISTLILNHHAGHKDKDRARGSSVFGDWPDALWKYTGQDDDPRELNVIGRGVHGKFTVALTSPGSGRIQLADDPTTLDIIRVVLGDAEMSTNELHKAAQPKGYKSNREALTNELRKLEKAGKVSSREGPRRALMWSLTEEGKQVYADF